MAHGATNTYTDAFSGSAVGATFTLPVAANPDYPTRAHILSVVTITGTVTGAVLTHDVQLKDGTFIDSGQPSLSIAGPTTSVFRFDSIMSTSAIKGFRNRVAGWTGGTSASVVTTVVYLL
jgi:hypothetical protein